MGEAVTYTQITYLGKRYTLKQGESGLHFVDCTTPIEKNPVVAILLDGALLPLSQPLTHSGSAAPVYLESELGRRVYRRSLCYLLAMGARKLFKDNTLRVSHSLGDGFFFTFDKPVSSLKDAAESLTAYMQTIVAENRAIDYQVLPYQKTREHLESEGLTQALQILNYRNDATIPVYRCKQYMDISYEPLVPYTSMVPLFAIGPYKSGLLLRYPRSSSPHKIATFSDNPLLYEIYTESNRWGKIMGISSVGDANAQIMDHKEATLIGLAESLQQRKINSIADTITASEGTRVLFVAGPSSSGKTTFVHKVALALKVLGVTPHTISLDSYYLPKKKIPTDAQGKQDLEALSALDLPLFEKHMKQLLANRAVEIPEYDFTIGDRISGYTITPSPKDIFLIEGIHGLNPKLSALVPKKEQLKLFISALTQLNLDGHNRISTTDNRLIRRIVRDNQFRGASPSATMDMWESVRHGEKNYIFPHQNEADIAFNSSLEYELSVLKFFAEPLLKEIKPHSPHYPRAMRLLTFLANFYPISADKVPKNSILREFIGGLQL